MTRPRHQPDAVDAELGTDTVCLVCGDPWPCRDELVDRVVDSLPSAAELPPETRSKLLILLRPPIAAGA